MENKGLQRIKDKILGDAEKEAQKTISEAENEAKEIITEKESEAQKYLTSELEKIELEKKLLEDKMFAQAKLNARKAYFTARETVIENIIQDAIKNLKRDIKYKKFLETVLSQNKKLLKEPLKVIVNKQDLAAAKQALTKSKIKGKVSEGQLLAGIILEDSNGKRIQESMSARLGRFKDEIRMDLFKIIEGGKSA